ncbi:hypothetical protein [Dysgonomonas sp. ZJ279]|uniref:hypothetical protein n=1 Tax=Dysgonomonas sp. ZJ279 TaxID=2709796 RepID=UPI0013E9D4CC|nr:hypothetical protein [Dysgonomonas sp. ZJ279]
MYKIRNTFLWAMICLLYLPISHVSAQDAAKVDLLSHWWKFSPSAPAQGTIGKGSKSGEFVTKDPVAGFTVKFNVNLEKIEGQQNILEIPDVLSVHLRRVSPDVRDRQNYPAYKMADGSLPVLEANINLFRKEPGSQGKKMEIGFPLAMLKNSYGKHEIILNFTGAQWTIYVDGELVDNDFPIGYPKWDSKSAWSIDPKFVENAEIFMPAIVPERDLSKKSVDKPQVQYWTPVGHNSWVGDVATIYHNGRFHLFYLYDRRHHSSKFGCGGHYFEHLSTSDFKTWTEHEPATPIEEQWETFGTGTPFVVDDKFCISYGLHTSRIYPDEKTMYPALKVYYENYGKTGFFDYNSFPTVPSGATYSVSQDGLFNFKKSKKIIHYSENPTIYTDADGKLTMLASFRSKGMWQSDSLDGGWYCVNRDFPPGGDCTFYFRWGKFDYIIGGFVDLWSKPIESANTEYKSVSAQGEDYYNGFNVPAISEISDGRFIMSAWLPVRGWGGPLLIHEMIQFPDGRIGTKWMKELIPETGKAKTVTQQVNGTVFYDAIPESFMLSFDVYPTKKNGGKLAVSFLPDEGTDKGCEFQLRLDDLVAQYSNASFSQFADPEKSLRQGGQPQEARNYAIEKLVGADKPFSVRMVVKYTDKLGGVLIDSEIAEKRTMITYRPDLFVKKLMFKSDNIDIKNVNIAPLK